jgi:hypothetical protein
MTCQNCNGDMQYCYTYTNTDKKEVVVYRCSKCRTVSEEVQENKNEK